MNVKWYLKREGILDMTEAAELDYYLVLTGPKATAKDVRTTRAWRSMPSTCSTPSGYWPSSTPVA